ncbi:MAG: alkaline phosphatase family protein [Candidatus Aminicenantes bacterium]|nr:alkaline phosphatase family protein [Candidatus Aminicenantes bacterium]
MNHPNEGPRNVSSLGPAIRAAYRAGQEDEALEPIVKVNPFGEPLGRIGSGDTVIFYDIRGEREIEITQSLTDPDFSRFPVEKNLNLHFVTMIEYDPSLRAEAAFAKDGKIANTLAEVLSSAGFRLAKIAESEKAAHIGFFMNGKSDTLFPGEERIIVPSPAGIFNYDQKPEMSAASVADEILRKIEDPRVPVVMANFANVDVVGHIENRPAVVRAVETVDAQLGRVVSEAKRRRVTLIVTADHGTVEEWLYPDGQVNTGHTKNPVPFILADFSLDRPAAIDLRPSGELADVAPTVLDLLGLPAPVEMTGRSLLAERPDRFAKRGKIVLLILDGWGMRNDRAGNLIAQSRTPAFDALWSRFPRALLESSGEAVGMPPGTVGNSEAGHLHLGAGRRILLDRVRIDRAVEDRSFFSNAVFLRALQIAREGRRRLHLMGIISHYSSHGTIEHLFALLQMAKDAGLSDVYVHGFIGRRGEKPESGALYVEKVEEMCRALGAGEVVTVLGRYWSLDREENWDRIEKAYRALVYGEGTPAGNFSDRNS